MTSSKTLFWFCISFITGIGFKSLTKIPQIFIWGILIVGILLIFFSIFMRYYKFQTFEIYGILGFCLLFLVLGIVRFQISEFNIANDKLSKFNDKPEKVILLGRIIGESDIRDSSQKLKVKVEDSIVLITANRYPEYKYLDKIKITGNLKTPPEFEDFNYKNYLLKDNIYSVMDFPKIELVSNKHEYNAISFLYEKILFLKEKLIRSIDSNFSTPQNSILGGIVFGNDENMPKDLRDKFNATGLSHLTAVSGGNIIILIYILMFFLLFLGFWRGQAFYFSVIFIWLYIVLVGLPASGVRAAIMGSIFLLAEKLGRQNTSSRTIVLAGALMLFQNPLLLFYDIGFQLSFLASMGIIHLKPQIDYLFEKIGNTLFLKRFKSWVFVIVKKELKVEEKFDKAFKFALDIIGVTISAQIFILPVIIYNFGSMSLVAPITNLFILPIVPFLMVFGFLASILGIFSGFLSWVFALPCYAMLFYFLKVLDVFSQQWATKNFENISWIWFLIYYFMILVLVLFFKKRMKPKFLAY